MMELSKQRQQIITELKQIEFKQYAYYDKI